MTDSSDRSGQNDSSSPAGNDGNNDRRGFRRPFRRRPAGPETPAGQQPEGQQPVEGQAPRQQQPQQPQSRPPQERQPDQRRDQRPGNQRQQDPNRQAPAQEGRQQDPNRQGQRPADPNRQPQNQGQRPPQGQGRPPQSNQNRDPRDSDRPSHRPVRRYPRPAGEPDPRQQPDGRQPSERQPGEGRPPQNRRPGGDRSDRQPDQRRQTPPMTRDDGGERSRPGEALSLQGPRGKLRVIPLGGVGEVGKNMTVVEYERDLILLDCGGKFPEEGQRGIDLIIPDVRYIKERIRSLRGILITHGHEDHIGGLPYVISQIRGRSPIPIYGSPLALGFIERKLEEHRLEKAVTLIPVGKGEILQFGQLSAEFIHVTHSMPDTSAIAVHSPVGTILDTADFKFDPTPVMGPPTDERRLKQLGDKGVLALFSDTVRVETPGSTPSEKVVMDTMDRVIREATGQVIVTTFASNISRIHMALAAAEKYGRYVAVAGRSMEQNTRVALSLGYLNSDSGRLISLDEILRMPREKRVLVITGSQGEAAAALARIAAAEHAKIRVMKGDVVLVSATPVPGNEETVARTIDNLFRRGAHVIYSAIDKGVHVSGHAGRDELRKMLDLIRPTYAVPIHGEYRHMALYRDLAGEAGVPYERVLLPEIGGVLEFDNRGGRHHGRVPSGSILVDRLGERGEGMVTLRDRDNLADDGVIVVTMVVDRETGALIAGPDLVAKGLRPELNEAALVAAESELRRALERTSKGEPQYGYLVQRAKEIVGKSLYRRSKSRPLILPVVTEL